MLQFVEFSKIGEHRAVLGPMPNGIKEWGAFIKRNPSAPGGLDRTFLNKDRGSVWMLLPEAPLGHVIEWGGKNRKGVDASRHYWTIIAVSERGMTVDSLADKDEESEAFKLEIDALHDAMIEAIAVCLAFSTRIPDGWASVIAHLDEIKQARDARAAEDFADGLTSQLVCGALASRNAHLDIARSNEARAAQRDVSAERIAELVAQRDEAIAARDEAMAERSIIVAMIRSCAQRDEARGLGPIAAAQHMLAALIEQGHHYDYAQGRLGLGDEA